MIMKYRLVLILESALCFALVSGSVLKDPLQPVWDGIEQLPAKILKDMQESFKLHIVSIETEIDKKVENFKTTMSAAIDSQIDKKQLAETEKNLNELMKNSLTDAFQGFYNEQMKPEIGNQIQDRPIIVSLEDTETKLSRHLDHMLRKTDFLFLFDGTVEDYIFEVSHHQQTMTDSIHALGGQLSFVKKILADSKSDVCSPTLESLQQFMIEEKPSKERLVAFESEWDATYHAVAGDLPRVLFHRDCLEILQADKSSPSGVYMIYPTRNLENGVKVWCDMETIVGDSDSTAGWTVMLRRRNTSVGLQDFNRTWSEYAEGFGDPGVEGEWWLGLNWVHELTYHQPYKLLFLLHDIEQGDYKAHYSNFRVESESQDFRLVVDGLTSSLDDAFGEIHHGQPFSTPDRDNDECGCNCAVNNQGGWWFSVCHRTVLTAPFPTSNDRDAKTIRWLSGTWLVFDDVTMMIKPNTPK